MDAGISSAGGILVSETGALWKHSTSCPSYQNVLL